MEQEYVLRLYDTKLLTFSLSEHGIEGLKAEIHEIDRARRGRLPLCLKAGFYAALGNELNGQ